MKNLFLFVLLVSFSSFSISQTVIKKDTDSPKFEIPDIPGYYTMKCDFHMHTVFSDGKVWPDVRVKEAIAEGLDAISITDHVENKTEVNHCCLITIYKGFYIHKNSAYARRPPYHSQILR